MKNANGYPMIGSRWQEVDPRFTRIIEVVYGFDTIEKKVRVKNVKTGRVTWAQVSRFNGKRGGYAPLPQHGGDS